MSIYTKTGDKGTTSLFGGKRTNKSSAQVEAYGTLDEFSSWLGLIIAKLVDRKDIHLLTQIQNDLHKVMAVLAQGVVRITNPLGKKSLDKRHYNEISLNELNSRTLEHEEYIDELDKKMPALRSFILPQGGETASRFHIARTVCRRAERKLVSLFFENDSDITEDNRENILKYINRLSDLLFMLARKYSEYEKKVT